MPVQIPVITDFPELRMDSGLSTFLDQASLAKTNGVIDDAEYQAWINDFNGMLGIAKSVTEFAPATGSDTFAAYKNFSASVDAPRLAALASACTDRQQQLINAGITAVLASNFDESIRPDDLTPTIPLRGDDPVLPSTCISTADTATILRVFNTPQQTWSLWNGSNVNFFDASVGLRNANYVHEQDLNYYPGGVPNSAMRLPTGQNPAPTVLVLGSVVDGINGNCTIDLAGVKANNRLQEPNFPLSNPRLNLKGLIALPGWSGKTLSLTGGVELEIIKGPQGRPAQVHWLAGTLSIGVGCSLILSGNVVMYWGGGSITGGGTLILENGAQLHVAADATNLNLAEIRIGGRYIGTDGSVHYSQMNLMNMNGNLTLAGNLALNITDYGKLNLLQAVNSASVGGIVKDGNTFALTIDSGGSVTRAAEVTNTSNPGSNNTKLECTTLTIDGINSQFRLQRKSRLAVSSNFTVTNGTVTLGRQTTLNINGAAGTVTVTGGVIQYGDGSSSSPAVGSTERANLAGNLTINGGTIRDNVVRLSAELNVSGTFTFTQGIAYFNMSGLSGFGSSRSYITTTTFSLAQTAVERRCIMRFHSGVTMQGNGYNIVTVTGSINPGGTASFSAVTMTFINGNGTPSNLAGTVVQSIDSLHYVLTVADVASRANNIPINNNNPVANAANTTTATVLCLKAGITPMVGASVTIQGALETYYGTTGSDGIASFGNISYPDTVSVGVSGGTPQGSGTFGPYSVTSGTLNLEVAPA